MSASVSQITSLTIVYSSVYSAADQRKHQSSASLAFVLGIHRWPVNSPHKWPVTRKMFPFDDVIMYFLRGAKLICPCIIYHDDFTKCTHSPYHWPFDATGHQWSYLTRVKYCEALIVSLLLTWPRCWIISRLAGHLKCQDVHVTIEISAVTEYPAQ